MKPEAGEEIPFDFNSSKRYPLKKSSSKKALAPRERINSGNQR